MLAAQAPLVIFQVRVFVPVVNPVIALVPSVGVTIVPPPELVHEPVPVVGIFPVSVVLGELMHRDWLPAVVAVVGALVITRDRVALLEQTPFVVIQRKIVVPVVKAVIVVVGFKELLITPPPDRTDQVPMPKLADTADNMAVGELTQIVWLGVVMLAVVGAGSTWMDMVDELELPQGLFSDHIKIFNPVPSPVTVLLASVGVVIVPDPVITLQVPIPPVGVAAASVVLGVLAQTVWFTPAFAMLGIPVTQI